MCISVRFLDVSILVSKHYSGDLLRICFGPEDRTSIYSNPNSLQGWSWICFYCTQNRNTWDSGSWSKYRVSSRSSHTLRSFSHYTISATTYGYFSSMSERSRDRCNGISSGCDSDHSSRYGDGCVTSVDGSSVHDSRHMERSSYYHSSSSIYERFRGCIRHVSSLGGV